MLVNEKDVNILIKLAKVIRAIKKYFYIIGCHLTQPRMGQKAFLVITE